MIYDDFDCEVFKFYDDVELISIQVKFYIRFKSFKFLVNYLSEFYYKIGIELYILCSCRVILGVLEYIVVFDRLGVWDVYLNIVFLVDIGIMGFKFVRG